MTIAERQKKILNPQKTLSGRKLEENGRKGEDR